MRKPSRFARARVRKRERGRLPLRARVDHWMPRARLCAPSDVVAQEYTRADGWARKRAHCAKRKPRLVRSRENSTSRRATAEKSATAVAYQSEIADSQAERCCARCQMRDEDTRLFVTSSRVLVAAPLASEPASPSRQVGERSRWRRQQRRFWRAGARRSRRAGAKAQPRAPPAPCAPGVRDYIFLDARLISCAARPAVTSAPLPAHPAPSSSPRWPRRKRRPHRALVRARMRARRSARTGFRHPPLLRAAPSSRSAPRG